jgi:3-methyladenine DNA glycosylase AlkD
MKPKKYFFKIKDDKYKEFTSKLLPNIPKDSVIGVKIPDIKKYAKEYYKDDESKLFLKTLPHKYLEENLLHGQLISLNKNFDEVVELLDNFLPYVDNWSVCDTIKPNIVKKYPEEYLKYLKKWIKSKEEYRVRFSIVSLLTYYLDDNFTNEINELVLSVKIDKYYINMAIAWYFSDALIKQFDSTIYIFKNKLSDSWTNNKSIQKARESFRISNDKKEELLKYKM